MVPGLRYGVTVRTLNSEIWTKSIKTNDATSMRARVRARHGVLLSEAKNGVGISPAVANAS
jgi:hypothetical protein